MKSRSRDAIAAGTALLLIFAASPYVLNPSELPDPIRDADYYDDGRHPQAKVELGRMLFFDKILSGNKNISCATCHHPQFATADGVALPLGEGPTGLGPDRRTGHTIGQSIHERVPRNTPALFNLGAKEFTRMFHDGRVEIDTSDYYAGGFITPARWKLPAGIENVLAAQAMFPITSPAEMAGQKGENEVADARSLNRAAGPRGVWSLLARRLQENAEYVELFKAAFPEVVDEADDISMIVAANAIAAFEASAFRADNSPFDQYLRGNEDALSETQRRGMTLFYGKAGCRYCHSGKFQTDHEFHAIAMPQIGPGKNDGRHEDYWRATGIPYFPEDFGRGRVTARRTDDYKFRTPSLRNVELTAPYGHAGTYRTLEEVVRHHLDPVASLNAYAVPDELLPPVEAVLETQATGAKFVDVKLEGRRLKGYVERDTWVLRNDELRGRIAAANELRPNELGDAELTDLTKFLRSLTDPSSRDLMHLVPERVPSGLPVED